MSHDRAARYRRLALAEPDKEKAVPQLHSEPKPTVLIVTGNLLLGPRKMSAIGDLYPPSGLR